VTLAVAGAGASIVRGTVHEVTFGGSRSIKIPANAQVLSDPVHMQVRPLQRLAVSVYLPRPTGPATFHYDAQQVNWISGAGDHTTDEAARAYTTQSQSWYFVDDLVVQSDPIPRIAR
jgi:hypothetical protein